jgi:hypothetical protein
VVFHCTGIDVKEGRNNDSIFWVLFLPFITV